MNVDYSELFKKPNIIYCDYNSKEKANCFKMNGTIKTVYRIHVRMKDHGSQARGS